MATLKLQAQLAIVAAWLKARGVHYRQIPHVAGVALDFAQYQDGDINRHGGIRVDRHGVTLLVWPQPVAGTGMYYQCRLDSPDKSIAWLEAVWDRHDYEAAKTLELPEDGA